MNPVPAVLAIVGPTASGKSALAVRVALRLRDLGRPAEIVGTDAFQVYRGLPICTAVPSVAERAGVPHHMLEAWPLSREVSVAEFQQAARAAIDGVRARGAVPIVVGGSGLYVSAVLDDLRFPGTDPAVRARYEAEVAEVGSHALHARLAEIDPAAAAAILPTNGRRIVRALEVIELTGEPFAATLPDPVDVYPTARIGLAIARSALDERIAERVAGMWSAGLADEVRAALTATVGRTAERAIGVAQMRAELAGTLHAAEARALTVTATAKFARRQQRWFARDRRVVWVDYDAADAVERCLAVWGAETST